MNPALTSPKPVTPFHFTTQQVYHVFRECPEAQKGDALFQRHYKGEKRTLCPVCAAMRDKR